MTLLEKNLYQQIHPARLITDWVTGIVACYLFWIHQLWVGVTISIVPSLIVSLIIIRTADLEKIKNSKFGAYFSRTYNKVVDFIRFIGFLVMAVASWWHVIVAMAIGFLIIVSSWTYGLLKRK